MSQLGLFDAPLALIDDARGSIVHHAPFLAGAEADALFVALRSGVDWHARRRVMYEREVDVPRLTSHFSVAELAAGDVDGIDASAARALVALAARASAKCDARFNSIGLNLYRDGNDSVAPHNDRLTELVEDQPIALVSLGATRRMTIRTKSGAMPSISVDLQAGSLLVMSHASQRHTTHGIAKTRVVVGERISVALRVRPLD